MRRRRIGVLTSGGDAPGMNACVRAVVRAALARGFQTFGIINGFRGMARGEGVNMDSASVAGILRQGGTVIGTGRFPEFQRPEVQREAVEKMWEMGVQGVVVAGGDGSMKGATSLDALGYPVVGVPCSIDNDIPGTELCIGTDTAINTALEAIDRIKDTANSHRRAMVVEVMGNQCGYLAQMVGLASGAEMVITPECNVTINEILQTISRERQKRKKHFIIVLAEGARWSAPELSQLIDKAEDSYEARHTVLGYTMRGGSPTAMDRILATRMGIAAADALSDGASGVMTCWSQGKVILSPLAQVLTDPGPRSNGFREIMEVTTL